MDRENWVKWKAFYRRLIKKHKKEKEKKKNRIKRRPIENLKQFPTVITVMQWAFELLRIEIPIECLCVCLCALEKCRSAKRGIDSE